MVRLLGSAAVAFVVAAVLAFTAPSSWPLLVVRIALIVLGIVLAVVGLQ